MKSIKNIKILKNKIVLLRADLNVPVDKKTEKITSDFRLLKVAPTIEYLVSKGAKVVICSHFGRPGGKSDSKFSLKFLKAKLEKIIQKKIKFIPDCIGEKVAKAVSKMESKDVILLENLRFYAEEKNNNINFAKSLASLADIYVNDAFGACHREHASVHAITRYIKSYAGLLIREEIKNLDKVRKNPKLPFVLIVGGAKIQDKIQALEYLGKHADIILVGGALANTFLFAKGTRVGASLYEKQEKEVAVRLMRKFCGKLFCPIDGVVCKKDKKGNFNKRTIRNTDFLDVAKDEWILDIGSATIRKYNAYIKKSKTCFWAGPLGLSEQKEFSKGTFLIARKIIESKSFSVAGGGDTVAALEKSGTIKKFSFVSTGGGASLEYLGDVSLPALKVL